MASLSGPRLVPTQLMIRDTTLGLRGSGAKGPPLRSLFPELSVSQSDRLCARLAQHRNLKVLRLRSALLQMPPFRRGIHPLSETVAATFHPDGSIEAGSMKRALDQGGAANANALAARLVTERLGGMYWADAPGDGVLSEVGSGLAIVAAASDVATGRAMLAMACARVGACKTLLLVPGPAHALLHQVRQHGCRVAIGALDPWPLLDAASELHVADDETIGLLALLAGIPVHCHQPTWFSGYGLTTDHCGGGPEILRDPVILRDREQFAAATLLDGAWYTDPFTGHSCTASHALGLVADWRRVCRANRAVAASIGMQFWKRRRMAQFLHTGLRAPASYRSAGPAVAAARKAGGAVAGWASRLPADLAGRAAYAGVPVVRVEDGFLRSVGLGSDFILPCSIVLDHSGLYYDPAQPSDLETLLATAQFTPALLARAEALVERVVQAGLTKYNTGTAALPAMPADKQLILVPGQVADDLSVRLGGGAASGNADLLRRVRAANPGAFILYRPHPDVDAGHRPGAISDAEALRLADAVSRGVPMAALIDTVDEVHTMTSLAGFEALLRGRHVVVWGRPFYAGWGLTEDMAAIPRRTRQLQIWQLAAGVLLLYPRYLDPVTLLPCPAEVLIDRLADPGLWRPGLLVRLRRLQGKLFAFATPRGRPEAGH